MKKQVFRSFALGIATLALFPLARAEEPATEYSKEWEKTFIVNSDATLDVTNKFGKVHTTTWDKNTIEVKIKISVDVGSKEKADKLLEKISIKDEATADLVNLVTQIDGKISNDGNKELHIDYTISMPKSNNLTVKNKFGDVFVSEIDGLVDLRVDYGALKCGRINGTKNKIAVSFGAGTFDYLNNSAIVLRYGSMDIDKGEVLHMNSEFSSLVIDHVKKLKLESRYDNTEIDHAGSIEMKGDFTGCNIDNLERSLIAHIRYGGLEVDNISKDFVTIDVEAEFGGAELNFESGSSFYLDAIASLGSVDFPKKIASIEEEKEGHTSYAVKAWIGNNKSSNAKVLVDASHGGVEIDVD